MIKFENVEVVGWEAAIRGMRNPMNSWGKSDSGYCMDTLTCHACKENRNNCKKNIDSHKLIIGPNDLDLMKRLSNTGTDHRKFMRMLTVYVDITAPLYWWKEFDTYKVGTVANSCSTMHKIHEKEFTLDDFSCEHIHIRQSMDVLKETIDALNVFRDIYLNGGILSYENGNQRCYGKNDKEIWWQMIQLLPSSYNQKRTVMLNYEVLANAYKSRKNHKLDEWCWHEGIIDGDKTNKSYIGFCDWIETLPYSELITSNK
jgi:hypothetical protein